MKRFTNILSFTLVLGMVLSLFSTANASPSAENSKVRIVVEYAPGGRAAAESALKSAGAEFHYSFDHLNYFAVSIPTAAYNGLSRNPAILSVEEDALRYPISIDKSPAPAPLMVSEQTVPYGVDMVQARDVWDADRNGTIDSGASTGSNRQICIIDSGYYKDHEDLPDSIVGGYTNISGGIYSDGSGHGSHVAGTIAALNNALGVVGVTPGTVNIYVVRVFGDDGVWAYSSTLVDAANRCASAGSNIISMSLGGDRSNRLEGIAFDDLYNQGILSIAAAGNAGTTAFSYPASYDSVVSVAAIDSSKTVAGFSQKNSQVELAAPGVGVLSTVPYLDITSISVDGMTYPAGHIEFSARGSASGNLVNGGLCDSVGSWSGKIVLCERGSITFYNKVINVQNGGGAAAAIYNNVPGGFLGTLGAGSSSKIIGISLSQEDGRFLVATKLGTSATISSNYTQPASGYEYYDGTSMATPHVSAVAALVWGAKPSATNAEIRAVLQQTAQDLGAAGRDTEYGFGLVQAKTAIDALMGSGETTQPLHVSSLTGSTAAARGGWTMTVTHLVVDANNNPVSGAKVNGKFDSTAVTCTTGSDGQCSITAKARVKVTSVTYTVTDVTAAGYYFDSASSVLTYNFTKP